MIQKNHSTSSDIGVATAALLPNFTFNGSYGQINASMNDLFKINGNFWSLEADISTPLFNGGSLWYKRKSGLKEYQQAQATYHQTVLSAFAQVAYTLRSLEHDSEALQAQSQPLNTTEEVLHLIQANYQADIANYLQIFIVNEQYHQVRFGYLQAQAQRLQDAVAHFMALGAGWQHTNDTKTNITSGESEANHNFKMTITQDPSERENEK